MTFRFTRLLASTALAASFLSLGGCALIESNVSGTTLSILEDGFTPPVLTLSDVEMGCSFSMVNTPLVGAARNFYGDPSLMETVMLTSAGVCSENQAIAEEMRYMRASRDKRSDEALDARINQKRLLATAAERQYTAFLRMKLKLQQKYYFKFGEECPRFKRDFDEMVYLLGAVGGLQAMQNDIASQQAVGVPTDIAPQVERAMNCLDNVKWWGVPQAARAVVWSIIPGADAGKDVQGTFDTSMGIGEHKGVRLSHVMAAIAAQSTDNKPRLRSVIQRFSKPENFQPSTEYRLLDAIAQSQITNISDRLWTQNTGTRTPINSVGKFWDDKSDNDVDAGSFLN
ncbi:MAG: hypothetical protein KBA70_04800 [Aquabacterium sp.]|jgi:hypothetical protein|uniref:hypothetical protein n=1 Tax=Aquabacterium sp. TaxID=1872578 RepID=UPI001B6BDD40|nr:hypothetical protein [Aquabacterium sp.]MBP7132064.1 hypothetical protein [Aquabacterium sp.]MBP9064113.1 hypothetical protein [Aquabacterium sp.]MDQ5927332.1 hypothetical protein [Pseudomonadota bacterium]